MTRMRSPFSAPAPAPGSVAHTVQFSSTTTPKVPPPIIRAPRPASSQVNPRDVESLSDHGRDSDLPRRFFCGGAFGCELAANAAAFRRAFLPDATLLGGTCPALARCCSFRSRPLPH